MKKGNGSKLETVERGIYRRYGKYVVPIWTPEGREYHGGIETLAAARELKHREEDRKRRRGKRTKDETCDHFAARWVRDYPRPQRTTNLHNAERVKQFAKDFKGTKLSEVTRAQARAWALENQGHLPAVRAMFSDAVEDGLAGENPFARLRLKQPRGRSDIVGLTPKELTQLTNAALRKHGDFGPMFAALIETAAWTGLRPGELYALRHSDIDYRKGEIDVTRQLRSKTGEYGAPKSAEARTVVLLPPAEAALRSVPGDAETIFLTKEGRRYSARVHHYYWDVVRALFWDRLPKERQERIPGDFAFYELRHFFGTQLAEKGMSPYDIALQMGHRDGGKLAMERYIHVDGENARERIRRAFSQGLSERVAS